MRVNDSLNCVSCDRKWEGGNTFHTDLGDKMKVFNVLADKKKCHEEMVFTNSRPTLPFPLSPTCKSIFAHFLIASLI